MKNLYIYIAVSVSGASVLALEILGTRILGPFYGVSLFLWSSLITVTLLALSFGYFLGGKWADFIATKTRLYLLLIFSGLWIILIPWLKSPILFITEPIGLRFAVLAAAFLLFFPPLTLLGMISPYAVKLKASRLKKLGTDVGNLYAVSTVASVISALVTGFFLIPSFSISLITKGIGILLILTASTGLIHTKKKSNLIISITVLIISTGSLLIPSGEINSQVLFQSESLYAEIKVVDIQNDRYLLIDGAVHSVIDKMTKESEHPHVSVMDICKYLFGRSETMLQVGLGAGSIARSFSIDGWKVDAVEIDPVVIDVAKNYFDLGNYHIQCFEDDGRHFIKNTNKVYSLIIMDAFGSSSIPFHLITEEAFSEMKNCLTENGVFAMNIESIGWHSKLVSSIYATLKTQFNFVSALPIHEPPHILGNIVILASDRELAFPEEWMGRPADYVGADSYERRIVLQKNHAWNNRFEPAITQAQVLTDDFNPVDIWAEAVNYEARKGLQGFFK